MKIISTFIIINIFAINPYVFASSQNYFDEALSYYNEGMMNEATFLFEKSAVFNPKNSETYVYLGYLNKELENLDKANHYFIIALTLQPDNLELNYLVGEYFYKDNDKDSYNKYVSNLEILCPNGCDYLNQIKKLDIE
jgi:tetratricopeptide (TPR) repeat protein